MHPVSPATLEACDQELRRLRIIIRSDDTGSFERDTAWLRVDHLLEHRATLMHVRDLAAAAGATS